MAGWHEGPLCGFALTTTTTDPETARIVTAEIAIWNGAGVTERTTLPPQAVSEVTGKLAYVLARRVPLVVFDAPLDLTVLDRETRRHDLEPFADLLDAHAGRVIDPLVLDKCVDPFRRGRRSLTGVCRHHKVQIGDGHDPAPNAIAAMRLAWKIGAAFPVLGSLPPAGICELQARAKAAQAASYQDFLRQRGKTATVDGAWPIRPWADARVPAVTA